MAYHLIIYKDNLSDSFILDIFLGSATTLDFYWESIGRALNLPFISTITEKADYEEGFILVADDLALFKSELEIFEKYWMAGDSCKGLPDGFLQKLKVIMEGVDNAIANGFTLAIV